MSDAEGVTSNLLLFFCVSTLVYGLIGLVSGVFTIGIYIMDVSLFDMFFELMVVSLGISVVLGIISFIMGWGNEGLCGLKRDS